MSKQMIERLEGLLTAKREEVAKLETALAIVKKEHIVLAMAEGRAQVANRKAKPAVRRPRAHARSPRGLTKGFLMTHANLDAENSTLEVQRLVKLARSTDKRLTRGGITSGFYEMRRAHRKGGVDTFKETIDAITGSAAPVSFEDIEKWSRSTFGADAGTRGVIARRLAHGITAGLIRLTPDGYERVTPTETPAEEPVLV